MERLFITELQIMNVRHLKDIYIPLSKDKMKHLILTGKNGSGKTSVLEYLNQYFMMNREYYQASGVAPFSDDVAAFVEQMEIKPQESEQTDSGVVKRLLAYAKAFKTLPYLEEYENCIKAEFNVPEGQWIKTFKNSGFLLAYYGAERKFQPEKPKHVEKVELKSGYGTTEGPRNEFIKYLLDLKMTEALAIANGKQEKAEEIKIWFLQFEKLLQQIFSDTELHLVFDEGEFTFYIEEKGHNPFGFDTLSSGYAAVLDIIVDLIMRMEKNANKSFHFLHPGIVLIDEIETHLHLEMQRNILGLLTTIFPNIQFIVTTHSPFILNSLKDTVIYDLENHVLVDHGLVDVPYNGIVEGYFNVDGMSQLLSEKFQKYKEIVSKEKLTDEDLVEVAKLEMFLDEIPDYLALDIATEYQRLKLEFANREDI